MKLLIYCQNCCGLQEREFDAAKVTETHAWPRGGDPRYDHDLVLIGGEAAKRINCDSTVMNLRQQNVTVTVAANAKEAEMTRIRILTIAAILTVLSGCASVHEQLTRNHYLSSGRAPEGWTPKKSLCPDFNHNGWQDHPPSKDGCFAPPPVVGTTPPSTHK